jgi:hypothetical protein
MSPSINFQTVRLSRGSHLSPDEGACVMELASMIAGEPFSDRPRSVCRVIGALLRGYNDVATDRRRQDLYRYASDVIGTQVPADVEARRLAHCVDALAEIAALRRHSPLWRLRSPAPRGLERMIVSNRPEQPVEEFMYGLARILRSGGGRGHAHALRLVDELVAIGASSPAPAAACRPQGPSHATSASSMS